MAKKRRSWGPMKVLEMIRDMRKDKLATDRYMADAEIELAKANSISYSTPDKGKRFNQFADPIPQSSGTSFVPEYIPPAGGGGSEFVPYPVPSGSSSSSISPMLIYGAIGLLAFFLLNKKPK